MRRLLLAFGLAATVGCDSGTLPTEPIVGFRPQTQFSTGSIPDDSDEVPEIGYSPVHIGLGGIASDADTAAPLGFVNVCWTYGCATTGRNGAYFLNWSSQSQRAPTFPFRLCLTATRDGFETRTECVAVNSRSSAVTWSPVLRRGNGTLPPGVPTPY